MGQDVLAITGSKQPMGMAHAVLLLIAKYGSPKYMDSMILG